MASESFPRALARAACSPAVLDFVSSKSLINFSFSAFASSIACLTSPISRSFRTSIFFLSILIPTWNLYLEFRSDLRHDSLRLVSFVYLYLLFSCSDLWFDFLSKYCLSLHNCSSFANRRFLSHNVHSLLFRSSLV